MPQDHDASIGEQKTDHGVAKVTEALSLGAEVTRGGTVGGSVPDVEDDIEIVDLSARYTIDRVLGKGGMGEVLLATDTRLNRKVAIKRIHTDATRSRTAVSRFLTEAKSIAALNHHNIVQVYDYGRDEDGPFLVMEYVDGGSLLDKCRKGALPVEEAGIERRLQPPRQAQPGTFALHARGDDVVADAGEAADGGSEP